MLELDTNRTMPLASGLGHGHVIISVTPVSPPNLGYVATEMVARPGADPNLSIQADALD